MLQQVVVCANTMAFKTHSELLKFEDILQDVTDFDNRNIFSPLAVQFVMQIIQRRQT